MNSVENKLSPIKARVAILFVFSTITHLLIKVNWVFGTNSNYLIPLSLLPDGAKWNFWNKRIHSLKYQRFTTLGCKGIGIRRSLKRLNSFIYITNIFSMFCCNFLCRFNFLFLTDSNLCDLYKISWAVISAFLKKKLKFKENIFFEKKFILWWIAFPFNRFMTFCCFQNILHCSILPFTPHKSKKFYFK